MVKYTWERCNLYQARIRCESTWVRILGYDSARDCYLCRSGKEKEVFWAGELVDFCTTV